VLWVNDETIDDKIYEILVLGCEIKGEIEEGRI
jgi:hypothetical protein